MFRVTNTLTGPKILGRLGTHFLLIFFFNNFMHFERHFTFQNTLNYIISPFKMQKIIYFFQAFCLSKCIKIFFQKKKKTEKNLPIYLGILHGFCSQLIFSKPTFAKNSFRIVSDCQKIWIQIRHEILSGLIWVHTFCKGYQQSMLINQRLFSPDH